MNKQTSKIKKEKKEQNRKEQKRKKFNTQINM